MIYKTVAAPAILEAVKAEALMMAGVAEADVALFEGGPNLFDALSNYAAAMREQGNEPVAEIAEGMASEIWDAIVNEG